jgi:hypothetical protein
MLARRRSGKRSIAREPDRSRAEDHRRQHGEEKRLKRQGDLRQEQGKNCEEDG